MNSSVNHQFAVYLDHHLSRNHSVRRRHGSNRGDILASVVDCPAALSFGRCDARNDS